MRDYIDSNSKKNEIRMLLKHPSFKGKIVAVLEGDTDIRLFRSLMDESHIKIESAVGKSSLSEIICDLSSDEEYSKRLFGICDADFMRVIGESVNCDSIFLTDTHDAETMIINSPAVDALISEYARSEESATILREGLVKNAMDAAYELGIFRYITHINNLNINFKGLRVDLYSNLSNLEIIIDLAALVESLITRSPNLGEQIDAEYLLEKYNEYSDDAFEQLQFCNGHDVTKFMSYILSQRHLSNDIQLSQEKVERSLRLSYGAEYFRNTKLYDLLDNWKLINLAPEFLC